MSGHYYNGSFEDWPLNVSDNDSVLLEDPSAGGPGIENDDPSFGVLQSQLRFWVQRVIVPIIVIVGVMGNSITIVVLTRRRMRSSTNLYLTALATSDLLYLVFNFTLSLRHYPNTMTYEYVEYFSYGHMLADACSNTSVWLTVSFTLERYIAVCHPIRGKALCTESRAKVVISCVFLFCFICTIPTPFEYALPEPVANETRFQIAYSELGDDPTYRMVFYWFTNLTFVHVPLVLLAIFNSFLIYAVHQSKLQRRKMTSVRGVQRNDAHSNQETKITIMLIAVVVLFLVCQVPTGVMLVYILARPVQYGSEKVIVLGINNVCNTLVAINASCNFVLYCAFSDKYRKTFLLTFLPCWYRPPSPLHSQSVYYKTTVTESTLSRTPSYRDRSPSQRSINRADSTRSSHDGSVLSRGRGSTRASRDSSSSTRNKQRYLTVPNGDPPGSPETPGRESPSPPPPPPTTTASSGRRSVMMCFRLPKGPLRFLGAAKKREQDELRSQSVPLHRGTSEHTVIITGNSPDSSDKLTCL